VEKRFKHRLVIQKNTAEKSSSPEEGTEWAQQPRAQGNAVELWSVLALPSCAAFELSNP